MEAPICRVCGTRHWSWEPHRFPDEAKGEARIAELPKGVTKGMPKKPAVVTTKVRKTDDKIIAVTTKIVADDKTREMIRKVGRPRKYGDSKERHVVYNRKRRGV